MIRILHGDCREVLRTLPDASVHCCVTSPPYWGLRSYLPAAHADKYLEIGSEPTVDAWVQTIVEVFREVRRVLRPDGTLWINLGGSYAGSRCGGHTKSSGLRNPGRKIDNSAQAKAIQRATQSRRRDKHEIPRSDMRLEGYKPKDLIGQPWMLAFALRADGWWLRQELIWAKKSPMPESVTDRFTNSHEHVFLLSKRERYWFDIKAVQEQASEGTHARRAGYKTPDGWDTSIGEGGHGSFHKAGREKGHYDHDHNSTASRKARANTAAKCVPTDLMNGIRPAKALLADTENPGAYADGKSERMGRGAGWRERKLAESGSGTKNNDSFDDAMAVMPSTRNPRSVRWLASAPFKGAHYATFPPSLIEPFVLAGCPEGGTVLDPFGGSGTTGLVCDRLGRNAILIDLDERNIPMATDRIKGDSSLFAVVSA